MELIGNILYICLAIIVVIITIVFIIGFVEALYKKINAKKIQERNIQELQRDLDAFANMIKEQLEEEPKKTTKKRTTKKKETK